MCLLVAEVFHAHLFASMLNLMVSSSAAITLAGKPRANIASPIIGLGNLSFALESPPSSLPQLGIEPGCYVLLPSGCPKRKFDPQGWTRDPHAAEFDADSSSENCELRRAQYNKWCGVEDSRMQLVPADLLVTRGDKETVTIGRIHPYIVTSAACFKKIDGAGTHMNVSSVASCIALCDSEPTCFGVSYSSTGSYAQTCFMAANGDNPKVETRCKGSSKWTAYTKPHTDRTRLSDQASYINTDMALPTLPTDPGCYVSLPSGCHKRKFKTNGWTKDPDAAKYGADNGLIECVARVTQYNKWCDTGDSRMMFVETRKEQTPADAALTDGDEEMSTDAVLQVQTGHTKTNYAVVGNSYCRGIEGKRLESHKLFKDTSSDQCKSNCDVDYSCIGFHWQEGDACFVYFGGIPIMAVKVTWRKDGSSAIESEGTCYKKLQSLQRLGVA